MTVDTVVMLRRMSLGQLLEYAADVLDDAGSHRMLAAHTGFPGVGGPETAIAQELRERATRGSEHTLGANQ